MAIPYKFGWIGKHSLRLKGIWNKKERCPYCGSRWIKEYEYGRIAGLSGGLQYFCLKCGRNIDRRFDEFVKNNEFYRSGKFRKQKTWRLINQRMKGKII